MKLRGLCRVCLVLVPAICGANSPDNAAELADIKARIRDVGKDVRDLASEKSAQLDRLKAIEKQYGELVNAIDTIKSDINQQEQILQGVRSKISHAKADIDNQRLGLVGLIKAAYSMGERDGLKILLNQRDAALSGRMLTYYDYISKARTQRLSAIELAVKDLQQLEEQKNTESQLLQVALEKKQQETDALQRVKHQREQLLSELDKAYSAKHVQLVSLIHDEKKLESLVASLQKSVDNGEVSKSSTTIGESRVPERDSIPKSVPQKNSEPAAISIVPGRPFAELQGQLPWPVQGAIVERFGDRRFETRWDGTVIGAREGADIRAVASGRVVFADWLRGYGLMLIVDHGKGYMTLYAFNQSLHKSVGDVVKAGDRLASVGRSGGRSQAALYFGIRKQGHAVDPELWCRKPDRS